MTALFDREPLPQSNFNLLTGLPAEVRHEILGYSIAEAEPIQLHWDSHNHMVPRKDYMYKNLISVCLSVFRDLILNHLFLKNNTFQFDSISDAWGWVFQLPIQYTRFIRSLSIPFGQGYLHFDQIFMRATDIRCLALDISPLFYLARFWWEESGTLEMEQTSILKSIFDPIHYRMLRWVPPIEYLTLNIHGAEMKLGMLERNIASAAEIAGSIVPAWLRRAISERYIFLGSVQEDFGPLRRFEKALEAMMRLTPKKRNFEFLDTQNGEAEEDDNPRFQKIEEDHEDQDSIESLPSEEPELGENEVEKEEEMKDEIPMFCLQEFKGDYTPLAHRRRTAYWRKEEDNCAQTRTQTRTMSLSAKLRRMRKQWGISALVRNMAFQELYKPREVFSASLKGNSNVLQMSRNLRRSKLMS